MKFLQKFKISAERCTLSADFCRNLRFLQFLQKVYTFCNFCRNLKFLQKCTPFFLQKFKKGAHLSLQKFKISAESAIGAYFLQKFAEILNFCRKVHTFCRNLRFLQFLQKFKISADLCREVHTFYRNLQKS